MSKLIRGLTSVSKAPEQEVDRIHDLIPFPRNRQNPFTYGAFRNSSDLLGDHDYLNTFYLEPGVEELGWLTAFGQQGERSHDACADGFHLKRLVKTPKLHLGDTGLAGAVLGIDVPQLINNRALFGQMLETFVYNELMRQASWHEIELTYFHYRDKDQYEVDLVIEQVGGQVAGVEVKAASTVREKDFRGLKRLRQATGRAFSAGVVLYDGDSVLPFGDRLFAVPISALWKN